LDSSGTALVVLANSNVYTTFHSKTQKRSDNFVDKDVDERILIYILNARVWVWTGFSRLRTWDSGWFVKIPLQLEGQTPVGRIKKHGGGIFTLLTGPTALRFMATGGPLAERRIRILPMNQHA
jgi:hypothetical protein